MKATKFIDFQRQQQQNAKNNNSNDSQNSNRGEQQLDNISNGGSSNASLSVSAPINNNNNNNNNPMIPLQNNGMMSRMQPLPALVQQQQQQQQINTIRLSGKNSSDKNGNSHQQILSAYNHQAPNSSSSPVSQQPSQIPIFVNNNNNNGNGMQKANSFNGNNDASLPQHQTSIAASQQHQQQQQHLQQQSNLLLFALNSIIENEKLVRSFIQDAQISNFSSILIRFADEIKQAKLELLQKDLEMEKNYSHGLLQANKGLMMNTKTGNNSNQLPAAAQPPPPPPAVVPAPPKIQKIIETKIEYVPFHVESLQNNLWSSCEKGSSHNSSFTFAGGTSDVARNVFSSLRNFQESFSEGPLMLFSRKPNPDNHSMKIGLLDALTRVLEKIASTSCFYDEDCGNGNDDGVDVKNKNIDVDFGGEAEDDEEVEGEGSRKREFVSLVHQAIQLLSLSKNSSSLAEDFIGSPHRFVNIMMKFSSWNQNTTESNNSGNRRRGRQDQKISNNINNNNSVNGQTNLFCYGTGTENETDLLFSLLSRNVVHTVASRRGVRFFSEFPSSNDVGGNSNNNNTNTFENSCYSAYPEDNYYCYVQSATTSKIAIHDKGNPMYFEDKIRQSFACSTFQLKHFVLPRSLTYSVVLESQAQFINSNNNGGESTCSSSPLTDSCVQLLSLFLEGLSQAIQHYQQICPIIQKSYRETRYQRLLQEQQQLQMQQQQEKKQKEQENNSNLTNTKTIDDDNISPIYIDAQQQQQQDESSNLAAPSALVPPTSSTKNVNNNNNSTSSPLTTGNDQDKKIPAFGSLPQNLAKMPELGHLLNSVRNYFQRYLLWMLSVCPTCPSVCNLVRKCFTPSKFSSLLLASNNGSNLRPTVMNFTLIRAAECVLAFGDSLRRLSLAPQLCAGKSCWPLLVSLYSCFNVIGVCESVLMPNSATTAITQNASTKTWMTPDQVVAFYATSTVLTPFVMCWNNCRNYCVNNEESMTRRTHSSEKLCDRAGSDEDEAVATDENEIEENCSEDSPRLESSVTLILYHLIAVRCCDKKNSFVNAKLGAEIMLDYENIVHRNNSKNCSKEKLKKIVANLLNVEESEIVWPDLKRLI